MGRQFPTLDKVGQPRARLADNTECFRNCPRGNYQLCPSGSMPRHAKKLYRHSFHCHLLPTTSHLNRVGYHTLLAGSSPLRRVGVCNKGFFPPALANEKIPCIVEFDSRFHRLSLSFDLSVRAPITRALTIANWIERWDYY